VNLWAKVLEHYLKFEGLCWVHSQKVSSSRRRWNWFKYQSRCESTLLREEPVRCHRLLVNQFLDKIKEEMPFIKKMGVIIKKKSITPKADLSA
jgi:hypothetical protein